MAARVTLLLGNMALVCEPLDKSRRLESKSNICESAPNETLGLYVIPVTLSFSRSKTAELLSKSLLWNGLFNGKQGTA